MTNVSYTSAGVVVRDDIVQAHTQVWQKLAEPGTWWTGTERVSIAAEVRGARQCQLCRDRKAALAPASVQGAHNSEAELPDAVIELVHRVTTDSGRLSKQWYEQLLASGLEDTHYVEALGVAIRTVSIDTFCRGIGVAIHPLPTPIDGEPSRRRPTQAQVDDAWVPMIPNGKIVEPDADLFSSDEPAAYVTRALSLVPDELRTSIHVLIPPQYMDAFKVHHILDPSRPSGNPERAISRAQMEFLASRVSALNQCFF